MIISKMKTQVAYLHSSSIMGLLDTINNYNIDNPNNPILKEDIVQICQNDGTYILIYYV